MSKKTIPFVFPMAAPAPSGCPQVAFALWVNTTNPDGTAGEPRIAFREMELARLLGARYPGDFLIVELNAMARELFEK